MCWVSAVSSWVCDDLVTGFVVDTIGIAAAFDAHIDGAKIVGFTLCIFGTGRTNAEPCLGVTDAPLCTGITFVFSTKTAALRTFSHGQITKLTLGTLSVASAATLAGIRIEATTLSFNNVRAQIGELEKTGVLFVATNRLTHAGP